MTRSIPYLALLAIFRPSEFSLHVSRHLEWLNSAEAMEQNKAAQSETAATKATRQLRSALLGSLLLVVASILAGMFAGRVVICLWPSTSAAISEIFQYFGIAVLLWATIGKAGWEIQTLNGTTLPEQVNDWIFRMLYVVGSFLLALSASLSFGATST